MSRACFQPFLLVTLVAGILLADPASRSVRGQTPRGADPSGQAATSTQARGIGAAAGGGAQADFDTLIDLIQATVAPDSWTDVGGDGAIESFPGGVYVDSRGILKALDAPTKAQLVPKWKAIGLRKLAQLQSRAAGQSSPLRAVSLVKLMNAYAQSSATDTALTGNRDVMEHVAGIYRIDYLVVDEANQDVVILGPAGPWRTDANGRHVNVATGRPVLRLHDWIVLARNAATADGQFMCTITPTQDGLARTQAFVANSQPLTVRSQRSRGGKRSKQSVSARLMASRNAWLEDFRSTLGLQRVAVTGVESTSRVARVLVEADHHMKQIGIGCVEASDRKDDLIVPSYLDRIADKGIVPAQMDVLRWWFTLHPDAISVVEDQRVYAFGAQAVKVLSENELLTRTGHRIHTGQSDPENERFAADFTREFERLCDAFPIYADLDNVFRLAIVAAVIRDVNATKRCDWPWAEQVTATKFSMPTGRAPAWVESIVNHCMIDQRQFVAAVSGGVQFDAKKVVARATDGDVDSLPRPVVASGNAWWWDE